MSTVSPTQEGSASEQLGEPQGALESGRQTRRLTGRRVGDRVVRGLGILIPLAFGLVLPHLAAVAPTAHPLAALGILLGVGIVGGSLLRLRRAVTLVPAAVFVGLTLRLWGEHALGSFFGWSSAIPAAQDVFEVLLVAVVLMLLPIVLGAALGVPLGIWLEMRLGEIARRRGKQDRYSGSG
jgi:hypothetical protein